MIAGKSADGYFENIPHALAWAWSQDSVLQTAIPAHEDECENRWHMYGVNHVPDADLLHNMGAGYVVLDDLLDGPTVQGHVRYGPWPHRLRIYTDAALTAQKLRDRFLCSTIPALLAAGFVTRVGTICKVHHTSRRLAQSRKHYFAQVTLQPWVKGVASMSIPALPA